MHLGGVYLRVPLGVVYTLGVPLGVGYTLGVPQGVNCAYIPQVCTVRTYLRVYRVVYSPGYTSGCTGVYSPGISPVSLLVVSSCLATTRFTVGQY